MRVTLVADVHANLPALEAVLEHARHFEPQGLWNAGDWIGYGAFPEDVVRLLRRDGAMSIAGDFDHRVLAFPDQRDAWRKSERHQKWIAYQWAWEHLSEDSREYLAGLPTSRRLRVSGRDVLLVHGSPARLTEHLYPDTPRERLEELAETARADLVVCGHSHRPFARQVAGTWFVNPGSVGRQDDGDPRASYATLELEPTRLRVFHHRVPYDLERTVEALREHRLPRAFEDMMRQGHKLSRVLDSTGE